MVYKSGQIFLPFCHNPRVWRTDGPVDGQTDRILIAIPRLHYMQRGKNEYRCPCRTRLAWNEQQAVEVTNETFLKLIFGKTAVSKNFWNFLNSSNEMTLAH